MNETTPVRPRNLDQAIEYLAQGKPIEVPKGYGTKTLAYLQQNLQGSWGADCQLGKFNTGWFTIEPKECCVRQCRKILGKKAAL